MYPDEPLTFRTGTAQSGSSQELYFLNTTGTLQLDDEARAAIRAQSLRDYHRKRKSQLSSGDGGATKTQETKATKRSSGRLQRFRLDSDGLHLTQTQPQLAYAKKALDKFASVEQASKVASKPKLGQERQHRDEATVLTIQRAVISSPNLEVSRGDFDPFNAFPLPSTPRIQLLVKQLMTRIASNSPTRDYRRYWFENASQDLACFYIALCQSSADSSLTLQKGRTAESVVYENQALHLINQRLGDPAWRLRNTTIGAVAALASYEISNGTLDAAQTHLVGLEKMIRLKGGIDHPSISQGLKRIVLWVDLVATSHGISVPRITSNQLSTRGLSRGKSEIGWSDLSRDAISTEELMSRIEEDLEVLTAAKAARSFETATLEEGVVFGEKAYLVTRRLMDITGNLASLRPATCSLDIFWALAASLYSSVILFETNINSVIAETLVEKLRQCLEAVLERDGLATTSRAVKSDSRLLWALTMGGVASEKTPQRDWFVRALRLFCQLLDPWSQKALPVRQALARGALWHSSLDDLAVTLWAEVDGSDHPGDHVWGSL